MTDELELERVARMAERNGLALEARGDGFVLTYQGRVIYGLDHRGEPESDLADIRRFITHQD